MNEPRVVESVTNECQLLGRAHESSSARAEQLIACLEGEIAKRDAIIYAERIDADLQRQELDAANGNLAGMRAELSAIKEQDPVAWQQRYIDPDEGASAWGYADARTASILQGRSDYELRPLYAAPVQQVSVPDVLREAIKWADHLCFECGALVQTRAPSVHVYNKTFEAVQAAKAMIDAAPAAPAADAGLVLEQAMYALIGIGYHENSGLVHELRQSLAAHRAKGVV